MVTTKMRRTLYLVLIAVTLSFTAAAQADVESGIAAYEDKRYGEAYAQLLPLADGGDAMAQYYVGRMHFYGLGRTEDEDRGAKYYLLAAEQGLAQAQHALADHYYGSFQSAPEKRRWKRAFAWYLKAAKQGYPDAYQMLSILYCWGRGVPKMPYLSEAWGILFQEAIGKDPWGPLLEENIFNGRCRALPSTGDLSLAIVGALVKKVRLIHSLPPPEISRARFGD